MWNGYGPRPEDSRSSTPLTLFVDAKRKINEIYKEVSGHITDTHAILDGISAACQVVSDEQLGKVEAFRNQVRGIQDVLERDHMKVALFGRTSNGKSTVINAMLRDKVLPSGIGHTTDCFLYVEGCEGQEGYMSRQNSSEKMSITSVSQLAHALAGERDREECQQSSILHIFWPKTQCHLLMNDVVLLDSPGIDVEHDLDEWINTNCMDADIFVLVLNAECTISRTEKSFFHKVSEKLSKPNIFILNNRWDASANEPEFMEAVKMQHLEREIKFLVEELKVMTEAQAKDRVFFVSAKEALNSRKPKTLSTQDANTLAYQEPGYQERLCEFENYERKLEECISQTAVRTKFEQHAKQGRQIVDYTQEILSQVLEAATKKRAACIEKRTDQEGKIDELKNQMKTLSLESKDWIESVSQQWKSEVSAIMTNEIDILSRLVNEFDKPFHPNPEDLVVYKEELQKHVEAGLRKNLAARCSSNIKQSVEEVQKRMTERKSALLPGESNEKVEGLPCQRDFSFIPKCKEDLFAGVQEEIEYRFFLSPIPLLRNEVNAMLTDFFPGIKVTEQLLTKLTYIFTAGLFTTVGFGAALLAYAFKTVRNALPLLGYMGCVYCASYLFTRLYWKFYKQKRVFKKQFADYASNKLKLLFNPISSNISDQIQQELSGTFARLSLEVETYKQSLEKELVDMKAETKRLEGLITKAKLIRDKASRLDNELEMFINQYILH